MKKSLLFIFTAIMSATTVLAQKIEVIDNDGNPIPLVNVLAEDGILIGTTDLDGTLSDVRGAQKIILTHIAYKSKKVDIASLKDGRVVMEDVYHKIKVAVVRPKPYIYMEYYFRAFSYIGDSLRVYTAGILPMAHEINNKYIGKAHGHFWAFGGAANKALTWNTQDLQDRAQKCASNALNPAENFLNRGEKFKNYYHANVDKDGDNRWKVLNPEGVVGSIVHSDGYAYTTLDGAKMQIYANKANNETKLAEKREDKNYVYQYMQIYKLDEEMEELPRENFVMETNHWVHDTKNGRKTTIVYLYAVDNAYLDKDEYTQRAKAISKGHSGQMPLSVLAEYERLHNIPELSPEQKIAIDQLKKQTGVKN